MLGELKKYKSHLIIFLTAAALFGIGFTVSNFELEDTGEIESPNSTSSNNTSPNISLTYITPKTSPSYFYTWAIEESNASMPESVDFTTASSPTQTTLIASSGQAEIATVPVAGLPQLKDTYPDMQMLPYRFVKPDDVASIYVRENSSIESSEELRGKKIAVAGSSSSLMALLALNDKHGIDESNTEIVRVTPGQGLQLLSQGEVDAAQSLRYPFDEEEGVRRIMSPYGYFSQTDLGQPPTGVFVVMDEKYYDKGIQVMEALDEASRHGTSNVENVTDYVLDDTGQNFSRDLQKLAEANNGEIISEMSEEDYVVTQEVLDYAYEVGVVNSEVNISEMSMQKPQ